MSYVVGLWQEGLVLLCLLLLLELVVIDPLRRARARREEFQAASMNGIMFLPPPTWTEMPGGWELIVPISENHSAHFHIPDRRGITWSDWNWEDPWMITDRRAW